jgi:hypothetical protein
MRKLLFLLSVLLFSSIVVLCQTKTDALKSGIDTDFVFTSAASMPTFKQGAKQFEKYLSNEIDATNIEGLEDGYFIFVVSKNGSVSKFKKIKGNVSFGEELKTAIIKSAGQWNAAMQDGHNVNAYCTIKVSVRAKTVHASIVKDK